jgi:hypothetical protein
MLPEWISKHTKLNSSAYSFVDHEYQERILRDDSAEVIIKKCSQVGISELSVRMSLALANIIPGYTIIYTLPTAKFAGTFMRTRIDPVVQSSPYLNAAVHTSTDNADVKRFGDSYIYVKGAQSSNAPISVPADHLVHDEVDFSSPEVISQYHSRLTHSKYQRKTKLSTPTLPKFGIDYEFQRSRRHFNMVKCHHCNHYFIPDYYTHVRVPGWSGDLHTVTKANIFNLSYLSAYVECPSCGKAPSLQVEHREWVCENPGENFVAVGYQVSPFDAPNIISPGYLIKASTEYKKITDFINFNLGLSAEDADSTLTREELLAAIYAGEVSGTPGIVMGLDMGLLCHCIIAAISWDGMFNIIHTEIIPMQNVVARRKELARQFRVRMTVVDALPYTETVMRMQIEEENLFAAYYTNAKTIEMYHVVKRDEDEEKGVAQLRQVNVNRNRAFDGLMDTVRAKALSKKTDEHDETWIEHLQDMKRVRQYTQDNELTYVWQKSLSGDDHFHHATLYAWIAAKMVGVATSTNVMPTLISAFPVKAEMPGIIADPYGGFWGKRSN